MKLSEKLHSTNRLPRIAVIGDVMLDVHMVCDVLGISPEDDLAYKIRPSSRVLLRAGGAANVAMNLRSLGAETMLCGVIGDDINGRDLLSVLEAQPLTTKLTFDARPTTTKTRYITRNGRHIIRIDEEAVHPICQRTSTGILECVADFKPDLVILSDYAKGSISTTVIAGCSTKYKYIVDPKSADFAMYGPAFAITPNEKEFRLAAKDPGGLPLAVLIERFPHPYEGQLLILKQSGKGADVYCARKDGWIQFDRVAAIRREVGDPTGCGDSLLAGVAFGMGMDWTPEEYVTLGVACGSCAFDHTGVFAVTRDDLTRELRRMEE